MTDAGEVAADIGLEYVVHLLGHDLQAQRLQSVVRVAPRPKAVTAVEEIRFEHGLDNARYRSLQQPIRDRGDPQWARSGFAWAFGYFNPPDRWCAIGASTKSITQFDFIDILSFQHKGQLSKPRRCKIRAVVCPPLGT